MHPILARKTRLLLYLLAWVPLALGLAALLVAAAGLGWGEATAVAVPAGLVYAFVCLAPWYLCRAMPFSPSDAWRLLVTWLATAAVSSGAWLLLAFGIGQALAPLVPEAAGRLTAAWVLWFAVGLLLFLLSAALHYLMLAVERSRQAETRGLAMKVLAREAELKALRTQIDPHFLFNSLHSISALTAADPAGARRMCLLLGDFLRLSLKLGARECIPLEEEMGLVGRFLGIEQVRFGDRLRGEVSVDADVAACGVPALLLQPLVENAVRHGIAELIGGGTIEVRAERQGDRVSITVENPCDPARRGRRGAGVGLANVRGRLATAYGEAARVTAAERDGRFRVDLSIPLTGIEPSTDGVPARDSAARSVSSTSAA
jgi:two-component system sensor histidine kinase AlgZ